MSTLKLTIFSDYVCPWCYVGQGVVGKLIAEHHAEVEWRPYYLHPDTPLEGMELPDYVKAHMAETTADGFRRRAGDGFRHASPQHAPGARSH